MSKKTKEKTLANVRSKFLAQAVRQMAAAARSYTPDELLDLAWELQEQFYDENAKPWNIVQEPMVEQYGREEFGEAKITHPAFATISASWISGGSEALFDSHVEQYGKVRIQISSANVVQSGYSKHIHGSIDSYIEVELSEAQWSAFVSRTNRGSGVPCTLRQYRDGDSYTVVPRLPPVAKMSERIDEQIDAMRAAAEASASQTAEELRALIIERVPKTQQKGAMTLLTRLVGEGRHAREFQHKCLRETQEQLLTESKIEVESLVTNVQSRLGLASIKQLGAVIAADPDKIVELIGPDRQLEGPSE